MTCIGEDGGGGAVAFSGAFAAASFVCGFALCGAAAIFTLSLAAVGWSAGLFVDIAADATLVRCHTLPASKRASTSAKINISYSTSYSSYFGGKKGISRNKTILFLLMYVPLSRGFWFLCF